MRTIRKAAEPVSLTKYRSAGGKAYESYADKDSLRICLAREQQGLCCYCLSRIRATPGAMKVEHWRSQSDYKEEQLDYSNLLGACLGNEGEPFKNQHCDTRKGNRALSRNPANPEHRVEELLRFGSDGRITSDDRTFDTEINDVLNLNAPFLKNNRREALTAFTITLNRRGALTTLQVERLLQEWSGDAPELPVYCQIVVYWLRKRLSRR